MLTTRPPANTNARPSELLATRSITVEETAPAETVSYLGMPWWMIRLDIEINIATRGEARS